LWLRGFTESVRQAKHKLFQSIGLYFYFTARTASIIMEIEGDEREGSVTQITGTRELVTAEEDNPNECDFALAFEDGHKFKMLIDSLKELIESANLIVSATGGLEMSALDGSHVGMVIIKIEPSCFPYFRCNGAKSKAIGVNFRDLALLVKSAPKGKALALRLFGQRNVLSIEFKSGLVYTKHEYKTLSIESDELGLPIRQPHSSVTMPSKALMQVCSNARPRDVLGFRRQSRRLHSSERGTHGKRRGRCGYVC
jgi:DNA polymerase III sliding clamp (beta) subunit (PCNA family)